MGGMVRAIERGWPQRLIHESAYRYQRAIESGDLRVVGVNAYRMEEEPFKEILRVDRSVEAGQVARLRDVRGRRDGTAAGRSLAAVREAATSDAILLPPILEAIEARVTLGEICGVLREEWGEYRPPTVL